MSRTSKSPQRVLEKAYEVGLRALDTYSHPKSPQKFTQPQLFGCLVLKAFFQTDYRGIVQILLEWEELSATIGMEEIPHFTTLQKAERRILDKESTRKLLQETIKDSLTPTQMKRIVELAAMDGSGFESRHVSKYFVKRLYSKRTGEFQDTRYTKYPYAGIICDCSTHMALAVCAGRGPKPDILHFKQLLKDALQYCKIDTLLADAGYDAEKSHVYAREQHGIRSIIPPRCGKPAKTLPKGKWRRKMKTHFPKKIYRQRWQVETVFSMMKRILGSALRARTYYSQCREINLKTISHNIMILWLII